MALRKSIESDLLAIGRPIGLRGPEGRIAELQSLAAVQFAGPDRPLGIAGIGHPLAIPRKADAVRRDSGKKWNELRRVCIVARQLSARQCPYQEQLLAVLA